MLDEARSLNFVAYLAWGGEPLLRDDIVSILQYAHDLGFYTSMVTNGSYLPEKAGEIVNLLDLTWVSLDYYSEYHDQMRDFEGAFQRAMKGMAALRRMGGRVAINCVLSKLNADAVGGMAQLADRLGVRLAFGPMEVFPGVNGEYALSNAELSKIFFEVSKYKKAGYPILNSHDYLQHLTSPKRYSCAQPKVFIKVSENGEVTPFWCKKNDHALGDLRRQSLSEVVCSDSYSRFVRITDGCSRCSTSCTVEASMFYSASNFLANCFKIPNPILSFVIDYAF